MLMHVQLRIPFLLTAQLPEVYCDLTPCVLFFSCSNSGAFVFSAHFSYIVLTTRSGYHIINYILSVPHTL